MTPEFAEKLKSGQKLYGTLIVSPSPRWPENVAKLGLDFVFIDTEHIALDRQTLSWMCQTYKALQLPPLVRITSPDPYLACAAIDGGASGIVVPYVENADQARSLVGAVKLRPVKGKKLDDLLAAKETMEGPLEHYIKKESAKHTLILNIESVEGIKNLDSILSVDGVDGVLIGPHDLSCSLGRPEDYRHPEFDRTVCEIITKARAHKVGAGIHCIMGAGGLDLEMKWIEAGANLILHSADIIAAMDALRNEIGILKSGKMPEFPDKERASAINI